MCRKRFLCSSGEVISYWCTNQKGCILQLIGNAENSKLCNNPEFRDVCVFSPCRTQPLSTRSYRLRNSPMTTPIGLQIPGTLISLIRNKLVNYLICDLVSICQCLRCACIRLKVKFTLLCELCMCLSVQNIIIVQGSFIKLKYGYIPFQHLVVYPLF